MFLRMLGFLFAISAVATLSGCATTLKDVDLKALKPNQAIVIVSAGASSPCKFNSAQMVMKKVDAGMRLISATEIVQLNNGYIKSDFPNEYAKVNAFVVEPGNYDFWLASTNGYLKYDSPLFSQPFQVAPGEAIYIGEIYTMGCGGDVAIEVRDRHQRDIEFIKSQFPDVRPQTRLLQRKF